MKRSYQREVVRRVDNIGKIYSVSILGKPMIKGTEYPIFSIRISGAQLTLPEIYIHAGIHGNEPAGTYAVLDFLENDIAGYRKFFNFTILPCLNPSGFEIDTRANANGVDINRDFLNPSPQPETGLVKNFIERENRQYLAMLDLHEDPTDQPVNGFTLNDNPTALYLYEKTPNLNDRIGQKIVKSLASENIEIWQGSKVYEEDCVGGVIYEGMTGSYDPKLGVFFDEFINTRTKYNLTPETPTIWKLSKRIEIQVKFLNTALNVLRKINNGNYH